MMAMIATPYTTPWMPGRILPSSAFSDSASGTRIAAPMTGPQIAATPPNSVTITACAETSMPNTEFRGDDQQHAGVEPAGRGGDRAGHDQRPHLPAPGVDAGGFGGRFVLLDRQQRQAEAGILHQQQTSMPTTSRPSATTV